MANKKRMSALDKFSIKAGYKNYQDYTESDYWGFQTSLLKKNKCYSCAKKDDTLKVRHLNVSQIGKERDCDVITVCEDCNTIMNFLVEKTKCDPNQVHKKACKYIKVKGDLICKKKTKKKLDKPKKKNVYDPSNIPKTPIYIKKKESKSPFTI